VFTSVVGRIDVLLAAGKGVGHARAVGRQGRAAETGEARPRRNLDLRAGGDVADHDPYAERAARSQEGVEPAIGRSRGLELRGRRLGMQRLDAARLQVQPLQAVQLRLLQIDVNNLLAPLEEDRAELKPAVGRETYGFISARAAHQDRKKTC